MPNQNQTKNCLIFEDFSFRHDKNGKNLINPLNFKLCNTELLFVIGPSGQGKSSFFLSILQNIFVSGKLIWQEQNLLDQNKKNKKKFLKTVGYLTQTPTSINFQSVYLNLAKNLPKYKNIFYSLFAIPTKSQREQIIKIMSQLGLEEKIYSIFQDLSGGQQQRVEIAKLMLHHPKIILADEPTSALDPKTASKIIDLIINFGKLNNSITIIISHNINLVKKYDGRILLINNGNANFYNSFSDIDQEQIDSIFGKDGNEDDDH
ncbi:ATP-binding cassette domain-containing protein [Mesomycoplasma ovipneumoniae]|uniref:ATP-binding cassette domain-containing protein n=1 Tax=Mesomycoplasma ovipneumoniae TaxID=29562 RepID=UPI0030803AFE